MTALLEIDKLRVRYGRVIAVRDVDLEVHEGEVVGLIGPNGAGKTSMLSAIFGWVPADGGSIRFAGEELSRQPPEKIVKRGLAIVPEGRQIFGNLTVAENLALGATPSGGASLDEDLPGIFERFPILEREYRKAAVYLSGGEQQQLAIARALLSRPRLLLLDEPSLGLAPLVIDLVFNVLEQLRNTGVTILLVEQVAEQTIAFADRTYVLRRGSVEFSGTREELMKRSDLAEAYLGSGAHPT